MSIIKFAAEPISKYRNHVFEAAAHTAFAHRSYVAFPDPKPGATEKIDDPLFDRIFDECERFGIGLILFEIPVTWDSFDFQATTRRHTRTPHQ